MTELNIVFYIYDDLNRLIDTVIIKQSSVSVQDDNVNYNEKICVRKKFPAVFQVDGYFMSEFIKLLNTSTVYCNSFINNLLSIIKCNSDASIINVKFKLVKPKLEVLDYTGNEKFLNLLVERMESEHAMSWLSTLGGAFSALGDNFENCAKTAGRISLHQFKIAFRLGEPPLIAMCKLYFALSLIQLGKLKVAKNLIQDQYQLSKTLNDFRLQNMCKGIWAKLQYAYKQRKINKTKAIL